MWLREPDLNRRSSGYEPDELLDCSIPRLWGAFYSFAGGCHGLCWEKVFIHQLLAWLFVPLGDSGSDAIGHRECCSPALAGLFRA